MEKSVTAKIKMKGVATLLFFFFCLSLFLSSITAVIVIDLGTENFIVSALTPNSKSFYEVVLNFESARKTRAMVAFHQGDRFFGDDAANLLSRAPQKVFASFLPLVGAKFTSNSTHSQPLEILKFGLQVKEDKKRKTFLLVHPEEKEPFSPEEVLAMLLDYAKKFTKNYLPEVDVSSAVLIIPPYLTHSQYHAIKDAASLVSLQVKSILPDYITVCIAYALSRQTEARQTVTFIDMSSSLTRVFVAKIQKEKVTMIANQWDYLVSGNEIDRRLVDYLISKSTCSSTTEQSRKVPRTCLEKKETEKISTNKRALGRLYRGATQAKLILSTNKFYDLVLEDLLPDFNLHVRVTQVEFNQLNEDLYQRLRELLESTFDASQNPSIPKVNQLDEVEVVGGSTRIPEIRTILKSFFGREPSVHLNSDEAAIYGGSYHAAEVASYKFSGKQFAITDVLAYNVDLYLVGSNGEKKEQLIGRLFSKNQPYDAVQAVSFRIPKANNLLVQIRYSHGKFSGHYTGSNIPIATYTVETGSNVALLELLFFAKKSVLGPVIELNAAGGSLSGDQLSGIQQISETLKLKSDSSLSDTVKSLSFKKVLSDDEITPLTDEAKEISSKKIKEFDRIELEKRDKAEKKNALESFINNGLELLESKSIARYATQADVNSFSKKLLEAKSWLEEASEDEKQMKVAQISSNLQALRESGNKILYRKLKHADIESGVQICLTQTEKLREIAKSDANLTREDKAEVSKLLQEVDDWAKTFQLKISSPNQVISLDSKEEELLKSSVSEQWKFTFSKEVESRLEQVERKIKLLSKVITPPQSTPEKVDLNKLKKPENPRKWTNILIVVAGCICFVILFIGLTFFLKSRFGKKSKGVTSKKIKKDR